MVENHVPKLNDWLSEEEIKTLHHFCKDLLKYRNDDDNFFALISSMNRQFKAFENGCKYVEGKDCQMFKNFEKGKRHI